MDNGTTQNQLPSTGTKIPAKIYRLPNWIAGAILTLAVAGLLAIQL